mgnify:FL=1
MPLSVDEQKDIRDKVVETIQGIYDPEIPVNIYDLGLIYNIDLNEKGELEIKMTLTSPSRPAAEILPPEVEQKTGAVEGVTECTVHVVWDPTWTPEMMSEEAKLELNMF